MLFCYLMKKTDKHKCLSALILYNEAEGARTLNLRFDSQNSQNDKDRNICDLNHNKKKLTNQLTKTKQLKKKSKTYQKI
jgi:hypothetical protein